LQNAVPYAEYAADEYYAARGLRTFLHRREARFLTRVACLCRRLDSQNNLSASVYGQSARVFQTAEFADDESLEEIKCDEAECTLEKVRSSEAWVLPESEEDGMSRKRARAREHMMSYGYGRETVDEARKGVLYRFVYMVEYRFSAWTYSKLRKNCWKGG
jgi:hypothetical protein